MRAADVEQAIRNYLARENAHAMWCRCWWTIRPISSFSVRSISPLIPFKAFLLSELIRPVRLRRPVTTHFHASERFPAGTVTRKAISDYFLQAAARPARADGFSAAIALANVLARAGDGDGFSGPAMHAAH